jgi:hypothetical protein
VAELLPEAVTEAKTAAATTGLAEWSGEGAPRDWPIVVKCGGFVEKLGIRVRTIGGNGINIPDFTNLWMASKAKWVFSGRTQVLQQKRIRN